MSRLAAVAATVVLGAGIALSGASAGVAAGSVETQQSAVSAKPKKAKTFKNCTALNKRYPHGVGKPKAKDKTSGTPVTNFKKSKALYLANKKSDRDKDGIACEKR